MTLHEQRPENTLQKKIAMIGCGIVGDFLFFKKKSLVSFYCISSKKREDKVNWTLHCVG